MNKPAKPTINYDGADFIRLNPTVARLTPAQALDYWRKTGSANWTQKAFLAMSRLSLRAVEKEGQ